MSTQAEVAAGVDFLRQQLNSMGYGGFVTEEAMFNAVLGILDAAETVRNAPDPPSADE